MAYTSYLTNNYATWTNAGFTLSGGDAYKTSHHDLTVVHVTISKTFTTPRAANVADITVALTREVGMYTDNPGYAWSCITLIDTLNVSHVLYVDDGDLGWTNVLNNYDITSLLNVAGTYTLKLEAEVLSSWIYESGYVWDESTVRFGTLLLRADTTLTLNTPVLVETTLPTESFNIYKYSFDLSEITAPKESFTIEKFTPPTSLSAIVLVATASDHKVYTFRTGTPVGAYDTPEVDFGLPGVEHTLNEIQFESQSLTPHVISAYVSIDSGRTWIYIGQDTAYVGKKGFIHPWITSESFIVRFYGTALSLFSYALFALPGSPQIRL